MMGEKEKETHPETPSRLWFLREVQLKSAEAILRIIQGWHF